MGLTKEQKAKRNQLAARVALDEGPEGDIAAEKLAEFDRRVAESEPQHRTWGDGRSRKPKPEPVVTEQEKQTALATLGPLQQALAAAEAAGDMAALRNVAAMATAFREGARARGMGIVSENQAAEVVVRAERAMGKVLVRMSEAGLLAVKGDHAASGRRRYTESPDGISGQPITLADLGIARNQNALDWRALASLSNEQFESLLDQKRNATERIAKVDFLRAAKPVEPHQNATAKQARREVVEALRSEDDIPQVVAWLAATEALLSLTDAIPAPELQAIGEQTKALIGWYNQQKAQRS